jgi:hypothetical protein
MASAESFPDVGSRVTLCTSCGKVVVAAMKKSPASAGKKVAGSRLELQLAGNRDRDASIFLVGMRTAKQGTLAGQTFTTLFLQSLGDGDGYGYVGVRERASSVWLMLALVRCGPVPHSQAPSCQNPAPKVVGEEKVSARVPSSIRAGKLGAPSTWESFTFVPAGGK